MVKRFKSAFCLSVIAVCVSTIALLLISFADMNGNIFEKVISYIAGLLFWSGLIMEQVFFYKANSLMKLIEKRLLKNKMPAYKNAQIGIISFFENREAIIADITLLLSTIFLVILSICRIKDSWLIPIGVAIMFFSFNMHCLLNGKNYKYIKKYINYKEQKKHE